MLVRLEKKIIKKVESEIEIFRDRKSKISQIENF